MLLLVEPLSWLFVCVVLHATFGDCIVCPPCLLLAVFCSYYSRQVDEEVRDNEVDTHMGEYGAMSAAARWQFGGVVAGLVTNDAARRLCLCPCDGQGQLLRVMREHTQFYVMDVTGPIGAPTNV